MFFASSCCTFSGRAQRRACLTIVERKNKNSPECGLNLQSSGLQGDIHLPTAPRWYLWQIFFFFSLKLYPSRTQQSKQREPSVKTLRSFSAEFWRHCVLSGGTQCRVLPRHQSEEMELQGGRGSAPFTETAYSLKYVKSIPKEINQEASTVWT